MNDFKKNNRFGGGGNDRRPGGFGARSFGRPSFGGGSNSRPFELFEATCASCGKSCEVPFKPNGKKPVYCKECFATNGGGDSAPRRDFGSAPSFRPEYKAVGDGGVAELKKQIEAMNVKLDKLIAMSEGK